MIIDILIDGFIGLGAVIAIVIAIVMVILGWTRLYEWSAERFGLAGLIIPLVPWAIVMAFMIGLILNSA